MLTRKSLKIILITIFTLLSAGCTGASGTDLEDPAFQAALETSVAGAVSTQAAEFEETLAAVSSTDTPAPTNTPEPASPTPEPSNTPFTEISEEDLPLVSVSVDTNCRSGPGRVYPYQAGFFVGDQAPVYGIDPSGIWLYIQNEDAPDGFCWIWGFYATTSSDTGPLPIFTPGPTPDLSPDFLAEFREVEVCDGKWIMEFTIQNIGPVTLESIAVHVLNTENAEQTGRRDMNSFFAKGGCDTVNEVASLDPGDSGFTVSHELSEDPDDQLLFATITVCTEDNLAVSCLIKDFYFTP
jgi:hypothetical protein